MQIKIPIGTYKAFIQGLFNNAVVRHKQIASKEQFAMNLPRLILDLKGLRTIAKTMKKIGTTKETQKMNCVIRTPIKNDMFITAKPNSQSRNVQPPYFL